MSGSVDIDALVALMRETWAVPEANGAEPPPPVDPDQIHFETLREFLARELPPAESLVGVTRNGTNLLPRYGWVMPWGREGCGKTSILVDLLFHAAAGIDWLVFPVSRPLRIVCVVNEGIPGGFQDKLAQKVEAWTGDTDAVLDNVAIYVSPWGEFSFRDEAIAAHARDFALDFGADYVALDPLHTLGTTGAGTPQETEEFKHVLRRFGLWEDLGVVTAHHSNKAGMVSGDWARHADTVMHLEKDGKNPATKMTLQKARPADPHQLGAPVLLAWLTDSLSYAWQEVGVGAKLSDADVLARVLAALGDADGPLGMGALQERTGGDTKRVRRVVLDALAAPKGPIVDLATGAGGYKLALRPVGENRENRTNEQTRMDTGLTAGEPGEPDAPGAGFARSGGAGPVSPCPPEGDTGTGTDGPPDEVNPFL